MSGYGNLQKIRNGRRTFAITPHIPGGFILPDDLIRIGEVAKKYKGILKLTPSFKTVFDTLPKSTLTPVLPELIMVTELNVIIATTPAIMTPIIFFFISYSPLIKFLL